MRYAYAAQAFGIILGMFFVRSAFGTLFIKHLGGTDTLAMWVIAIPGVMRVLQIPISIWIHPAKGKKFLLLCWALFGILMGFVALIPSISHNSGFVLRLTVITIILAFLINLAGATFWFPLLHDIIPENFRGRFFGRLRAIWSTTLFVATICSGLFLGSSPETWQFQVVILVGVLLVFLRNSLVVRIPTPSKALAMQDDFSHFRHHLKSITRDRQIGIFSFYFVMLGSCAGFLSHPLVLYMRNMGFSVRNNIVVFGFTTLGMVLALFFGGKAIDSLGTRRIFLLVHSTIFCMLLLLVGVPFISYKYLVFLLSIIFVISGAAVAVSNLACTSQLFYFAPERGRALFLSLLNIFLFLGPSVAALITALVSSRIETDKEFLLWGGHFNLFQIMLSVAATVTLALLPILKHIKDVRYE